MPPAAARLGFQATWRCLLLPAILGVLLSTGFLPVPWAGAADFPDSAADSPVQRVVDLWRARKHQQAHALIDSLLPPARAAGDTALLVKLLGWQGRMYGALGRSVQAEAPLRETLVLARAVDDTVAQCHALRWLGVSLSMQGRYAEGRRCYDQLLDLARRFGDSEHLGWGLAGQGFYSSLDGDEASAQASYRQAIALFRKLDLPEAEHFVLLLLGNSLVDQGVFDEARECYRRTAAIGRESGNLFLQGLAFSNLGTLEMQSGDPQAGLEDFQTAARLFRRDGSFHEEIAARLQVVHCLIPLQLEQKAVRELQRLQKKAEAGGFHKLRANILVLRARLAVTDEARDLVSRDLRDLRADTCALDFDTRGETTLALARVLRQREGPAAALDVLEPEAEFLRPRVQVTVGLELELARGHLLEETGRHRESLDILRRVADRAADLDLIGLELQALPPAATAAEALGDSTQALDLLRRSCDLWLKQRTLPVDPHWREVYGAQSRQIYIRLAALLLRFPGTDPPAVRMARAFDAVQVFKARTLQERMAGPGADPGDLRTITLARLQEEVLRTDEVLLDFFSGEDDGLAFLVDRQSCRVFNLPGSGAVGERLRLFHDFVSDPGRVTARDEAGLLQQVIESVQGEVFGQVLPAVPAGRQVVWSPDGDLNFFPLNLALAATGSPVFRVPSASILAGLRDNAADRKTASTAVLLAVGSPATANGIKLPAIRKELAYLKRFRGARVRSSLDPEDIGIQLACADLLHFATHARADGLSPWRSYLEIPASDETAFFRLDAAFIAGLRLPCRLVVLAGCESAGGRVLGGEGVQSLANSFLGAGVPAVLATLWPVDDEATAQLITRFYGRLAAGDCAAVALGRAQSDLAGSRRFSDPFFWAGFVLAGDGSLEIRLERRLSWPDHLWWILPLGGMIPFFWWRNRAHPRNRG